MPPDFFDTCGRSLLPFPDHINVRRSRIKGQRIRGSTEIEILRACVAGVLPTGPIYFSTYIKSAENDDYIAMALDADLVKVFGPDQVAARIRRCES
ncbi:hypothetical protein [Agrobacterium tumefaciens]|uniref:hypothetical protein n=1 Tax=Agrobacterium tumefaciens TaxID=358 RepID=UPI001E47DBAD|nr:hypothetical protein [Agrobacterium tumefaciens]